MQRINEFLDESFFHSDSLYQLNSESSSDIFYQDRIIVSITDEDARYYGKPRQETAIDYLLQLKLGIDQYREQNSFKNKLTNAATALGILLLLGIFIYFFDGFI